MSTGRADETKPTMRCDAAFQREILLRCYDALEQHGFTRYRKANADWQLANGFHCWVGLNTGLYPDRVQIQPNVGVHVVPVMRLYTGLEGRKYSRGVATYARHMGELTRGVPVFHFTRDTDLDAEALRLAALYRSAGLAFARAIADYDTLLPLLKDRLDMLGGYPERVACALYFMGRKAEAAEFTRAFLAEHRRYFERFAVPFLEMLGNEQSTAADAAK
jgi:hypothetical protein